MNYYHDNNTGRQYKVMLYDTQGRLVQYKQAGSAVATVINGIQAGALYYVVALMEVISSPKQYL